MIDSLLDKFEKAIPARNHRRALLHVVFWITWLSRSFYDTESAWGMTGSLYFVGVVLVTQVPLVYIHLYVLVPFLMNRQKYLMHILATVILIVIYSYSNYFLLTSIPSGRLSEAMNTFLKTLKPNYDLIEGFIVVMLTYALKYMLVAFITQNELLKLQKEKLQLELKALKAQINPHFFFNTLNNLYSLTLKNSEKSSEVVLKLSDMMRYVLYECNEDQVPLEKEISFVKNYLELERLRFNDSYKIDFSLKGHPGKKMIAPMLLVEFIENAFKHGLNRQYSSGWVRIEMYLENDTLHFKSSNSKGTQDDEEPEKKNSGIGLLNIQKRLSLIYTGHYALQIEDSPSLFFVHLQLELAS